MILNTILDTLNPKQKEAVTVVDGPVLVVAGPGSGKTRCLARRAAYLIQQGIAPDHILAVTFTNKAAREMKERIARLLPSAESLPTSPELRGASVGTFHAVCLRVLRRDLQRRFTIFDESDRLALLRKIIREMELSADRFKPGVIQSIISRAKDELQDAAAYRREADGYYARQVGDIYEAYQAGLVKAQALDFDDLIMLTVKLWQKQPDILERYQERWRYVMVDEAHDINTSQYALINLLAQRRKNLWLIADSDQSIYSWRGADARYVLNFAEDYPRAKTILLEQNYRSTKNILAAGCGVINQNAHRHDKRLWTDNPTGDLINIVQTDTGEQEAQFIAEEILNLVREDCRLNDCAVLYRTNAQSRSLEEAFLKANLPYKIVGAVKFYDRLEIKDILAYLRLINNIHDTAALQRAINTPPRRLARFSQQPDLFFSSEDSPALNGFRQLIDDFKKQSQQLCLSDLVKYIIKTIDYESYLGRRALNEEELERRQANLEELGSLAAAYNDTGLERFLEETALFTAGDEVESRQDVVNLMTMHCAKGLEWPIVFVAGCEENIFPHARSFNLPEQMEEERRLCYVALTRAKRKIYLTCARQRRCWGQLVCNSPSRFIGDIPENLVKIHDSP